MKTAIIKCYNLSTIEVITKLRDIIDYLQSNNIAPESYKEVVLEFNNDIKEIYISLDSLDKSAFYIALHTKMKEFTYGY